MLIPFLVGIAVGAALLADILFSKCVVRTKHEWKEDEAAMKAMSDWVLLLKAQNAKLRVALGTREMAEEGKEIAAMAMAALDVVIVTQRGAMQEHTAQPGCVYRQED